jgi:hypothetical protein
MYLGINRVKFTQEVNDMGAIDEKNYEWFKRNLPDLIKEHKNKFLIVYEESIRGVYSTFEAALTEALHFAKPGEFLIQRCAEEEECAQIIYSLMRFSEFA